MNGEKTPITAAMRAASSRRRISTPKAFGRIAPSPRHSATQASPMAATSVRSFLQLALACESRPAPSSAPMSTDTAEEVPMASTAAMVEICSPMVTAGRAVSSRRA